jgi:hypothetical protein
MAGPSAIQASSLALPTDIRTVPNNSSLFSTALQQAKPTGGSDVRNDKYETSASTKSKDENTAAQGQPATRPRRVTAAPDQTQSPTANPSGTQEKPDNDKVATPGESKKADGKNNITGNYEDRGGRKKIEGRYTRDGKVDWNVGAGYEFGGNQPRAFKVSGGITF